jgi:hypothetical protein
VLASVELTIALVAQAEVNLVFDQLIFLISDEMYSYFKNYAASSLLDKR